MTLIQTIQTASPPEFWFVVVAGICVTVLAFYIGMDSLKRARVIENMPTARIRSAAQGYAELEGVMLLMDGPPVVSPLTAHRCCWWRYSIEEKVTRHTNGKTRTSWETIDRGVSDSLFLIDDGTGQCLVDPESAKVLPSQRSVWFGSTPRPTAGPKTNTGFLAGSRFLHMGFGRYRYTEELLLVGRAIYALGMFRTQGHGGPQSDLATDVRDLLIKWKQDPKMRALLDVNRDGELDVKEWEAARRMAEKKVLAEQVDTELLPDCHVLSKSRDRRPFVLSAIPQADLISRYRRNGWLAVATFLIGVGCCAWVLQTRGVI